jgi:hypothetical protein
VKVKLPLNMNYISPPRHWFSVRDQSNVLPHLTSPHELRRTPGGPRSQWANFLFHAESLSARYFNYSTLESSTHTYLTRHFLSFFFFVLCWSWCSYKYRNCIYLFQS